MSGYIDPDVEWNAALDLIRELSDELAQHGDTDQDGKVVTLVAKARAFLEDDR